MTRQLVKSSEHAEICMQEFAYCVTPHAHTTPHVGHVWEPQTPHAHTTPFRGCGWCGIGGVGSGEDLKKFTSRPANRTGKGGCRNLQVQDGSHQHRPCTRCEERQRQSGECHAMGPKRDQPLNDLLARWHRWASAAARLDDTLLRDFDVLASKLSPRLHAAVVVMARNAASGASVWSSARVDAGTARRAKARLLELLEPERERWFGKVRVLLNERGNRIGESNPMAECTDHDVELARQLRDEGFSLGWIARKFEVSKSAVAWWCNGGRRGQAAARVKEVTR